MTAPLFRMTGVSKRYGGVRALENVDLTVDAGRIHAVLGENGAGKSSLIKCMSGVVQPDSGTLELDGGAVSFATPAAANAAGVVCIFQELSLIPDLSVADNIMISNPPMRFGLIDRKRQRRLAEAALARAGAEGIHPMALVRDLPLSRRQLVEIAKALARDPRLLILDEATSALSAKDVEAVFRVLKELRAQGLALVYISHRMSEITELADACSVFRNGRHVATFAAGSRSDGEVVEMMIGREYSHVYPAKPPPVPATTPPVLEVRNLSWGVRLTGISFALRPGEVVGLDGQGQRELLLALFGVLRGATGDVLIEGRAVTLGSPSDAKATRNGIALIPEDRKTEGLMLPLSVGANLSFASLDRLSKGGIVDRGADATAIETMVRLLARGTGRNLDPRRPRLLHRDHGRGDPDHAAAIDPVRDADSGCRAAGDLWNGDPGDVAALRALGARGCVSHGGGLQNRASIREATAGCERKRSSISSSAAQAVASWAR